MEGMELEVMEEHIEYVKVIENARDVREGEPFHAECLEPLKQLWVDPGVQRAWERGNEVALPEK